MPPLFIAPHLTSGLGNRLFQYACAKGLAEKWHGTCVYRRDAIEKNDHGSPYDVCELFTEPFMEKGEEPWQELKEPRNGVYTYTAFPVEPPPTGSCFLTGGFRQSERYFPSFPLRPNWDTFLSKEEQANLLQKYDLVKKPENAWFVHIRLGDYKILPHHQIDIFEYVQTCLQKVPRTERIFLFSDEPELCADWVHKACALRNLPLTVCNEPRDITTLWLMSQMWGGAIVSNSTFSWWGAYFAHIQTPNPDMYVAFFPETWGQGMPPANDIVPAWGRRVKN